MQKLTLSRHRVTLLGARARVLREFATVSERKLWLELSAGKAGVSFHRQVPLAGRWIADFFASGWLHSRSYPAR
jgi:very-short-patch-repair endonuclease